MTSGTGIVPIRDIEGAIRRNANVCWPEPLVLSRQDVPGLGFVSRAVILNGIGPHDTGPRITMNDLVPEYLRQQPTFIQQDARRRARSSVQKIGDDSRIVLMPFVEDFGLFG